MIPTIFNGLQISKDKNYLVIDKDMNIINNTCTNPRQAFKIIEELVKENGSRYEDYAIFDPKTMHCIPLHKVMT